MEPVFKKKNVELSLDCIELVLNYIYCPKTTFYVINLNSKTRARFNETSKLLKQWRLYDLNKKMFHYAKLGDVEMVKFYISKGADNFQNGLFGAAMCGKIETVQYFIDNIGAEYIVFALQFAVIGGQLEMVKYLFGFRLERDTYHKVLIILKLAIRFGKLNIVKYIYSEKPQGVDIKPSMEYVESKYNDVKDEDYQKVIDFIKENERV